MALRRDKKRPIAKGRQLTVLNLGLGVQSTTLYLLSMDGELPPLDYAVFADPQEERGATYEHLEWLRSLKGPPILTGTAGKLGDHLLQGKNSTGGRFASIPAFTPDTDHIQRDGRPAGSCNVGRVKRQCTSEYKIEVVEEVIRRQILGLKRRAWMPRGTLITQWFGISDDEGSRRTRIMERTAEIKWAAARFPLCDMGWDRARCKQYLKTKVPHTVTRSACVFCPFMGNMEWADMQAGDPVAFARAVQIDEGLRREGSVVNRNMDQKLYLHRTCLPIAQIDFKELARLDSLKPKQADLFSLLDCGQGMCGN